MAAFTLTSNKGQVFLPDFVGSVVIFSFILMYFMIGWNGLVGDSLSDDRAELTLGAERSLTLLLDTQGYPNNWNSSQVEVPGLRNQKGFLSARKILTMKSMAHDERTQLFRNQNHNFTLLEEGNIARANGTRLTFGVGFEDAETLISLKRSVVVNKSGEKVRMEAVYREWE